jgi:hypothetical protein
MQPPQAGNSDLLQALSMAVSTNAHRILIFSAKAWTIIAITVIAYSALYLPQAAESTDYVMTFYASGHLVASGQAAKLYPESGALSFTTSPFNQATHVLLPGLPHNLTAAYMYSPLVAWAFAPLSHLRPNLSLLVWQGLSLVALVISCALLARLTHTKATDIFFLSFLLFPVFITIWIGQLGLVFGLLPLCLGYFLLTANRSFLAGLAWSFLSLKPQYLPAVGLVGLVLALVGRINCLAGIALGSGGLFLANLLIFPSDITLNWLTSLRASDAIFSSGLYAIPIHLVASLPSNLLMLAPLAQRSLAKWSIYCFVAALWITGLWQCRRMAKSGGNDVATISMTVVVGTILLPLVAPHMLYYDLALLLPAGATLFNKRPMQEGILLPWLTSIAWLSISLYFPLFLSFTPHFTLPLVLDLILLGIFIGLLRTTSRLSLDHKRS